MIDPKNGTKSSTNVCIVGGGPAGLMLATLLITLLVEVPIDNDIRRWTVETLPVDWESKRLTWKHFHALRTLTSVAALSAFLWGILLPSGRARREAFLEIHGAAGRREGHRLP